MLRRFLPKTVVGQLMVLLATVLVFAQIVNLGLLVGAQRLQARASAFDAAVDHAVRLIVQLPEDQYLNVPYSLAPERGGPTGSFFLSHANVAEQFDKAEELAGYNSRFKRALEYNGVVPIATSVTFMSKSPIGNPPRVGMEGPPRPRTGRGARPERRSDDRTFLPPPPRRGLGLGSGPGQPLQEIRLSAEVAEGIWFNALMPHAATEPLRARILLATLLLLTATLLAVWWFARKISRPISSLVVAAENLGRGNANELLPETGPTDIRDAAVAFNNMQTRLTRMLETQRNMLRAVGHDLRTPLTALRLRAENIEDEAERGKVIATLNDMTVMTEEILSWARDASGTEDIANVDLGSLLESLVDDYQDQGMPVDMTPFKAVTVKIRRVAIKRALQNLINNAVKYGGNASLSVENSLGHVCIHIDDNGPGVEEVQLKEILKPFVRLEASRNKETGGTGLGLSISDTIAQIHGGALKLTNLQDGGLRVSLKLPI